MRYIFKVSGINIKSNSQLNPNTKLATLLVLAYQFLMRSSQVVI